MNKIFKYFLVALAVFAGLVYVLTQVYGPKKVKLLSCEESVSMLKETNSLKNAQILIEKKCPIIYLSGWVEDTSNRKNSSEVAGCSEAWNSISVRFAARSYIAQNCKP